MKNQNTQKNNFYDEYLNDKNKPRRLFLSAYNYFFKQSPSKKKLLAKVRDSVIKTMGVTSVSYTHLRAH